MARKEVDRAIAAAWDRSGPDLFATAEGLRRAIHRPGATTSRERAKADAHRLAGVLGTLGSQRGSELARALERHLGSARPAGHEIAQRIADELVETLERTVADRKADFRPVRGRTVAAAPAVMHVLVVDDDPAIRELLRDLLERAGSRVSEAPNGREGLRILFQRRPQVIVLDVEMPDLDGWETLERIRDVSDVPVLMLTAHDEELEKVRGLRGGADDYVTKPFGAQELLARVEVLARGKRGAAERIDGPYGDARLSVDPEQRLVAVDGEELPLTPIQYRLIATFVAHPNQILSREQLLELVWGGATGSSGDQVKVQVGRLRRRLADAGLQDSIETVRGFGYRYRS